MPTRILSISGLRGIVGDGLEPEYISRFARALARLVDGGTVVISRDGRGSGLMMREAVLSGLAAEGCQVLDAGIASTPTCGLLVRHLGAAAGLQITASHNPAEWNGLKPFGAAGRVFDAETGARLIAEMELLEGMDASPVCADAEVIVDPGAVHRDTVLGIVDAAAIRGRRLRVVLDCNHGSGAVLGPELLNTLDCQVTVLGGTPDGEFAHPPEPLEEHLTGLCRAVVEHGADVGFAQDPDADRLAVVDETGRYIGEELTMALAADRVLSETPGAIVVNGSSSRVTADIVERYPGSSFFRSHVGEANVVAKMDEVSAVLGGEGNGGVIDPRVGGIRDSFVGMALVLDGLARRERGLADWVDGFPVYEIVKQKVPCPPDRVAMAVETLRTAFGDAVVTEGDGLRLDWDDRWVQVRGSNTEPIVRVISEAPDRVVAHELCDAVIQRVRAIV
ncbi:MAG: phosphoglucosamine mutase [Planctomycetota bacterium]|nr:phosphoglucosamine mutase [Planctomycetota bacterium]